jgi:NitT/TauT family transport system permease protein
MLNRSNGRMQIGRQQSELEPAVPVSAAPDVPRGIGTKRGEWLAGTVVVAGLLAVMQVASLLVPDYIMPPPLKILAALREALSDEWLQILITLARLFAAVLFAMLVGTAIGVIMGMMPRLRLYLRWLIVIDTGIPALSWMLVAVFWFRDPEIRIFFILVVILIPFYTLSVHDGIRALPTEWLDMCESFRPSRGQILRYLILPHIVPYVLLTTKSMIGYATRMVIFAEVIGSALGIGAQMGLAQATFHMDSVLAWTVLLVVLNLVLQAGITVAENFLLKWRPAAEVR